MILDCRQYTGTCDCGRVHTLRTREVIIEPGALQHFDKYMEDVGLTGFRAVLYDTNTYHLPAMTHVRAEQEIILEAQGLHSEQRLIEDMMTKLVRKPDVIVVVGSGTLMDFGRYSAHKLEIPFVAVPTLVSSDGFTANICSIIINGQKKSIPMEAPSLVVCDLNIISGAPMALTISGIQDILAKHISLADWKIAHLVAGEYFCSRACGMAQEALNVMIQCANNLATEKEADFEAMAYAQMLSGLTMQMLSHSRAASGAEHLIAHLVEMKPRGFENAHGMHGECVGVGTVLCAEEYHRLAEKEHVSVKPFTLLDEAWVTSRFGHLAEGIFSENEQDVLNSFPPESIVEHWQEIRDILQDIPTAETLTALYQELGAKYRLEDIGIDPALKAETLDTSAAIRNRLTLMRLRRLIKD